MGGKHAPTSASTVTGNALSWIFLDEQLAQLYGRLDRSGAFSLLPSRRSSINSRRIINPHRREPWPSINVNPYLWREIGLGSALPGLYQVAVAWGLNASHGSPKPA